MLRIDIYLQAQVAEGEGGVFLLRTRSQLRLPDESLQALLRLANETLPKRIDNLVNLTRCTRAAQSL